MDLLHKKRGNLILTLGLIMIVFIIGCSSAPEQTSSQPASSGKTGITREVELEVCAGMPQIGDAPLEAFCLMGLAAKHKDTSLCSKVSFSGEFRTACYGVVAQASKNAAICEEAGSFKDSCYREYARTTKDHSVCDKITDVNEKDNCFLNVANTLADASFCEKVKVVPSKDSCYQNMAMRFQDKTFCDRITGANQKQDCLRSFQQS